MSWLDQPLALGTDYDSFDAEAAVHDFEASGADARVRLLRRGFAYAMSTAGFVPYDKEWWHWSHGDDVWAQAMGRPALYDIVEHPPIERTAQRESAWTEAGVGEQVGPGVGPPCCCVV